MIKQKSVVLCRFPFSNLVDYKIRPAIVVSKDGLNRKNRQYWLCPITTKSSENTIEITKNSFSVNLENNSFIRHDVIFTLEEDKILKELGQISKDLFSKLKKKIVENMA